MAASALLTIFLFLFLHASFTASSSPSSTLVNTICIANQGALKDFQKNCLQALNSDPRTKVAKNYLDLAKISLDLAVANTTHSRNYILNALRGKGTGAKLKPILKSCAASYHLSVNSFRSARAELGEDSLTANYDAKIAQDYADQCEDVMNSSGVHIPFIKTGNYNIRLYSSIGFEVTNHLD